MVIIKGKIYKIRKKELNKVANKSTGIYRSQKKNLGV
jgi:hypothetical protein